MRAQEIFSDALIMYLKRIWIYLLFSLVITSALFVKVMMLTWDGFSVLHLAAVWMLAFTAVLFSVYLIACTLKIHPHKGKKTLLFSAIWSLIICAVGMLFRFLLFTSVNKWTVYIVTGVLLWTIGSILVLSACHMLKKNDTAFFALIGSNGKLCAKSFLYMFMIFVIFTFTALVSAQPSKVARGKSSQVLINKKERISYCIFVFLFIPLYILMFTVLYEAITDGSADSN